MSNQSTEVMRIAKAIEDASMTLSILPKDKARKYFDEYSGMVHSPNASPFRESKFAQFLITPEAISRLEEVLTWMRCIDAVACRVLWRCAAHIPLKIICEEFRCSRITLWRKRQRALIKISKHLKEQGRCAQGSQAVETS